MPSISLRFLLAGFLLAGCAPVQIVPPQERVVERVEEISFLSKDQIFDSSLEWMALTFTDSKAVIDLKDKEAGIIIGKGITSFQVNEFANADCRFTMSIEIKEKKYRITFNNFNGLWKDYGFAGKPLEEKRYLDQVKKNMIDLNKSLYMFLAMSNKRKEW